MKKIDRSLENMMKVGHIQVADKFGKKWCKKIEALEKKYKIEEYVCFLPFLSNCDVCLDCDFTLEQLEAIVKLLREYVKDREKMYKKRDELWEKYFGGVK